MHRLLRQENIVSNPANYPTIRGVVDLLKVFKKNYHFTCPPDGHFSFIFAFTKQLAVNDRLWTKKLRSSHLVTLLTTEEGSGSTTWWFERQQSRKMLHQLVSGNGESIKSNTHWCIFVCLCPWQSQKRIFIVEFKVANHCFFKCQNELQTQTLSFLFLHLSLPT